MSTEYFKETLKLFMYTVTIKIFYFYLFIKNNTSLVNKHPLTHESGSVSYFVGSELWRQAVGSVCCTSIHYPLDQLTRRIRKMPYFKNEEEKLTSSVEYEERFDFKWLFCYFDAYIISSHITKYQHN